MDTHKLESQAFPLVIVGKLLDTCELYVPPPQKDNTTPLKMRMHLKPLGQHMEWEAL